MRVQRQGCDPFIITPFTPGRGGGAQRERQLAFEPASSCMGLSSMRADPAADFLSLLEVFLRVQLFVGGASAGNVLLLQRGHEVHGEAVQKWADAPSAGQLVG